jgi:hypothetical protein
MNAFLKLPSLVERYVMDEDREMKLAGYDRKSLG